MAVTVDKPAPYAPTSAIMEVINRYRNRGLPSPIDSEVLGRAGVSDSLIPRTLQALHSLELIDEGGNPTDALETLRLAPEPDYQDRLKQWLSSVYADVLSFVDPATDNEVAVRDAFRSYNPIGQQPRMVSLFLGLFAAAGVIPEKKSADRPARIRPNKKTGHTPAPKRERPRSKPNMNSSSQNIPQPLAGLLSSLPKEGERWSQQDRDKFFATFGAVLDYCFPIADQTEQHQNATFDTEDDL